jgi:hypothetical protein
MAGNALCPLSTRVFIINGGLYFFFYMDTGRWLLCRPDMTATYSRNGRYYCGGSAGLGSQARLYSVAAATAPHILQHKVHLNTADLRYHMNQSDRCTNNSTDLS